MSADARTAARFREAVDRRLDAMPLDEAHERRVAAVIEGERAKREARLRLDAEERGPMGPPSIDTLRDRLARPVSPTAFRITGWQPRGSAA